MTNNGNDRNPAVQTYLDHENELIHNHRGKYILIDGSEIIEISNDLRHLLERADKEGRKQETTIVQRIDTFPDEWMMS